MENNFLANLYARELQAEYTATGKCLEKIPEKIFDGLQLGLKTNLSFDFRMRRLTDPSLDGDGTQSTLSNLTK